MISSALLPVADALRWAVGDDNVLAARAELVVYECDGFVIEKNCPDVVVFPLDCRRGRDRENLQHVRGAVFAARGRHQPGRRMFAGRRRRDDRAHADEADPGNQPARSLRRGAAGRGERLADQRLEGDGVSLRPDPSSQGACTIGGNVATNSGGPHTLKYGVTVNHTLGVEAVMADGSVVEVGGPAEDRPAWT